MSNPDPTVRKASLGLALDKVLQHEGGYSFDADDRGGETKFGISKRAYPNLDIKNLTIEDAMVIYDEDYWQPMQLSKLLSQEVADLVFSLAVNMGRGAATKLLQSALKALGLQVEVDGKIGPKTLSQANLVRPEPLLEALQEQAIRRYLSIAGANTTTGQGRFLVGWIKRIL